MQANPWIESASVSAPTLEFASLCLRNALLLLPHVPSLNKLADQAFSQYKDSLGRLANDLSGSTVGPELVNDRIHAKIQASMRLGVNSESSLIDGLSASLSRLLLDEVGCRWRETQNCTDSIHSSQTPALICVSLRAALISWASEQVIGPSL
ncbi:unnamed protein product [Protopolystoma xenopodis]|uniref:Uncharacterized protein n=1 Tax=Protopolystoma xenopodis TaxID=117903 RepID=A0A448X879_9PLAT|nr:unnamed protein product [Protopolystoma xenopodis]